MTKNKPILLFLATALIACASPAGKKGDKDILVIGGADASENTAAIYQMPTPNELFRIVREMSGEGQKRMMSPAANIDRYATMPKRALNFGVYATDMVYASSFRLTGEVVRYYLTCKRLGDELGLSDAFNDQDFARLERNLAYGDSLDVIGNAAYERVYQRMQEDSMGATLALVLAGGWMESMHLVMRQVVRFDEGDPLEQRVAEQKVSLDHLIELMDAYKSDPAVADMLTRLTGLRDIYDTFKVVRSPHRGGSPSGRMILGDDVNVIMTADGFKQLDSAVEALRDYITLPEDSIVPPSNT